MQQQDASATPPNGTSPIAAEEQDAHGTDIVTRDAIIGVAEVDTRDGVGASGAKVGDMRQEQYCQCDK